MVDIYRSRRGYNNRCLYYKRKVNGVMDNEELIHNTKPSGLFYAKISSSKYQDSQDIAGVFRTRNEGINIETEDIVHIDKDDLVLFRGEIWVVGRVNTDPIQKNSEFSTHESNRTYIELVRGV